ncbi:hypothetical protein TWF481_002744 [Arthrobotrys musiformis]|uniref:Uncharacterized protein n=1 Tax=Arthrobotrys musiformis TaxID=47236 RepID=A0AAV9VTJ8_9PEZI
MLPTYTKQQLPASLPKDHPSVIKSYFAVDGLIMHAILQIANSIGSESSYCLVPPSGTLDQIIECLKLPSSFQDPDLTIQHPSTLRIPALIELQISQLKDIFPIKL